VHFIKLVCAGEMDNSYAFYGVLGLLYWLSIGIGPILLLYLLLRWLMKGYSNKEQSG
jgi:hypothetical protein